jgi:hypothetical protein
MNPAVGTDQTKDTYWIRMKEYFDANNLSGIDRTERSLRSHWSAINANCQKLAGVQKDIDVINPSGTNEVDRVILLCPTIFLFICICVLSYMTHLFSFVHFIP